MNSRDRKPNNRNKYEKVGELVSIYLRGRTWWVHYTWDEKQERHSLKTRSKKEARRKALAEERNLLDGRIGHRKAVPTIAEVKESYIAHLKSKGRAKRTIDKYEHCFKLLLELADRRGVHRISDVNLALLDAFEAERCQKGAPKTVVNDVVTIRQLVNFAIKRKLIRDDPLAGLEIEKPPRTIQPVWSWDEVQAILAAAESPFQEPLLFYAESGARFGEGRWLTWRDVDFDKRVVHIRAKDGWKPKTGEQRVFHMSDRIYEMLQGMPRRCRWVFTAKPTARYPEANRQISERTLLAYLKKILKNLGLKGHLHTFKHSFVTHAVIDCGIERDIVRSWVGTLDDGVLDYYVHISDDALHNAMRRLSDSSKTPSADGKRKPE